MNIKHLLMKEILNIKQFKTYHPYKKTKTQKIDDGIDHLINKVQGEIKEQETLQSPQPVA